MKPGFVRTYSGLYVDLLNMQPSDVQLSDIAHHLSLECRWGGACRHHYSVAEHSLWVARWAKLLAPSERATEVEVYALLHDAHEAYLKDIPTPIKRLLGAVYQDLCDKVDEVILASLGLAKPSREISDCVHQADAYAAWGEQRALCPSGPPAGERPPLGLQVEMNMVDGLVNPRPPQLMERAYAAVLDAALRNYRGSH